MPFSEVKKIVEKKTLICNQKFLYPPTQIGTYIMVILKGYWTVFFIFKIWILFHLSHFTYKTEKSVKKVCTKPLKKKKYPIMGKAHWG